MPHFRSILSAFLLLFALCAAPSAAARGLPLMRHWSSLEIPIAAPYNAIAFDREGTLYVGGGQGVLRYRGGDWELFELPGKAGVNWLLTASDGRLYVGGEGRFGILHTEADGSLRFEDLRPRFDLKGEAAHIGTVQTIAEGEDGFWFRTTRGLYFLGRDGRAAHWTLPAEARDYVFAVGREVYLRVAGVGLMRFDDGQLVPVPGAEVVADLGLGDVFRHGDGLLLVADDGFYQADATGIRKLDSEAGEAFVEHTVYAYQRLPDGQMLFGGRDGVLMRVSPELELLDSIALGRRALFAFGADREGGIWAATEIELIRLRLPSPWTIYNERLGLNTIVYDSAWYDGALWAGTAWGVLRASGEATESVRHFVSTPWLDDAEVHALEATAAGLVIGSSNGLAVLDPGAEEPRELLEPETSIFRLQASPHDPSRLLAVGEYRLFWLALLQGRWEVVARWDMEGVQPDAAGVFETAPGELWFGSENSGAWRWRFDPATLAPLEKREFGVRDGLRGDTETGTHLLRLGGELYAVAGERVNLLRGEAFVPAELSGLPGLTRPMELEAVETPLGEYAFTLSQIWHRAPGVSGFRRLNLEMQTAPGYHSVEWQGDGRLRISTWGGLLQFDPAVPGPEIPPARARLEKIEVRTPGRAPVLLPLASPGQPAVLPPRSGLALELGLASMESGAEFSYRMLGYRDEWTGWSPERNIYYRIMPPGDFVFELKARSRGGGEARTLHYPFQVQALWHQRRWAQVLLWLAAALAVAGIAQLVMRLRIGRVVARNRSLEQRISERTAELERANRKLAELATEDGLTGVANRRAMEQALAREWQRCGEHGEPLAVVMIDADHFKRFNDRYGHLAGDVQLRRIAEALAEDLHSMRELLARYGGEEFALILPGLDAAGAAQRAERIRQRVQQRLFDAGMPSSISLGVAVMVPDPKGDRMELVRRADAALYRAKEKGRNRVELADG